MTGKLIIICAIIFIVVIIVKRRKAESGNVSAEGTATQVHNPGAIRQADTPTNPATLIDIKSYKDTDPTFNESEFNEKLTNLYLRLQGSIATKDIDTMSPYLTEELFEKYKQDEITLKSESKSIRISHPSVLDTSIAGWKNAGDNDLIIARLRTRSTEWLVDDTTGKILNGSNSAEIFTDYEWSLVRKSGAATKQGESLNARVCPNCGAPISINHTTRCEYCDTILTVDSYNWRISEIKTISTQNV